MGVIYERTSHGKLLRHPPSPEARERLLERFYRPHHARLLQAVETHLNSEGECLILDCHRFPAAPHPHELDQSKDRPDICLGTGEFHTPAAWTQSAVAAFGA